MAEGSQGIKWNRVGIVKNIFLYPLEGGHPKKVATVNCTKRGLKLVDHTKGYTFLDRSFIVYDSETKTGNTIESLPYLTCLTMDSTSKTTFNLHALDDESTEEYPLPDFAAAEKIKINYHGTDIEVCDCGDEVAQRLSKFLVHSDLGLRLGMHCGFDRRNADFLKGESILANTAEVKMMQPHFSTCLIIAEDSIKGALESISNHDFQFENFRPNIVVETDSHSSFPDDHWKTMKIKNCVFSDSRKCAFSDAVTINIRTGLKSHREEPFRNMMAKRLLSKVTGLAEKEDIPVMGVNTEIEIAGLITIGDPVYIATSP